MSVWFSVLAASSHLHERRAWFFYFVDPEGMLFIETSRALSDKYQTRHVSIRARTKAVVNLHAA